MITSKPVSSPNKSTLSLKLPWLTTSSLVDIRLFFFFQPVFWALGIELILPVLLAVWIFAKQVLRRSSLFVGKTYRWAILFFLWQLMHIATAPGGELDIFLKNVSTLLAVVCLSISVYNLSLYPKNWAAVVNILNIFGAILVLIGTIFIVGVWDGEFRSAIGSILPQSVIDSSYFFSSIVNRSLGIVEPVVGSRRVQSTIWHPSSYATLLLVISAVQWVKLPSLTSHRKLIHYGMIFLTLVNLVFTFSRTTYVSYIVMLTIFWWLGSRKTHVVMSKVILILGLLSAALVFLFTTLIFEQGLTGGVIDSLVYEFRPESILVRLRIYTESFNLIIQKPLWGWTVQTRIEGLPSYFTAGSHSDYLSAIFQYGIVGLILYLGFILAVWQKLIWGYRKAVTSAQKHFFQIGIALMAALNIRQLTSTLIWDIYVVAAIWVFWGLCLALAHQVKLSTFRDPQIPPTE